jgi:hypothetical protein
MLGIDDKNGSRGTIEPGLDRGYMREDIELLAAIDEAHDTLSGPATQKLLPRPCYDFG